MRSCPVNSYSLLSYTETEQQSPVDKGMSSQTLSNGDKGPVRRPDHFFDHFSIRDVVLGKGGFGTVFLGRHRRSNTLIAIKTLDPREGSDSLKRCKEIAREVQMHRMASEVEGTIKLFGASYPSPEGRCYLAMELANMGTLHLYLYRHKMLPEEQVRNLMFQIVQAVAGLHRTRIVHRDVKPSNILLQRRTEDTFAYSGGIVVKLADFGHAEVIPVGNELLRPGTGGTNGYKAPEFQSGSKCGYGSKVDIWSAGAVMKDMFDVRPRRPPILDWTLWDKEVWKIVSREAKDLLARCLDINASNRVSAEEALQHPWFGNAVITAYRSRGMPSKCDECTASPENHTGKANMAAERFLCAQIDVGQRGRQPDRIDGEGARKSHQKVNEPTKSACQSSPNVQDGNYFSPLASVREKSFRLEAIRTSNLPFQERALLLRPTTTAPPELKRKRAMNNMETGYGYPVDEPGGCHNAQCRTNKRIDAIDDDALASVDGPWRSVNAETSL
ncbi:unnamed protein product [Ascophyllum nodosum]